MDIAAALHARQRMLQIKASAGSGKTYTLTRLFLNRLSRCEAGAAGAGAACLVRHDGPAHWGEILAITFTNAAATEMRDRVIRELKNVALGNMAQDIPLQPQAAARWLDVILRDLASLNIRTIDSLLHRIVRAAALDLGLPPDFQPVFASSEAMQPRLDRLMDEAWHGDADKLAMLRAVYGGLIFQGDRKGFVAGTHLVEELRSLWDGFLDGSFTRLSPPAAIEAEVERIWTDCRTAAEAFLKESGGDGVKVKTPVKQACEKIVARNADFKKSSFFTEPDKEFLNKGSACPASLTKAWERLWRTASGAIRPLAVLEEAGKSAQTVRLARMLCEEFERDSRRDGNIPAVLIPLKAREALSGEYGVPEALCRLGSRLRHFMLDEFQDTSRQQWQAMHPLVEEALAQGGTLTWVGDVKQAIYGWRGGDTRLFDELARDAGLLGMAEGCRQESLPCNRRSRQVIVEHNNRLFSRLADRETAREVLTAILGRSVPADLLEEGAAAVAGAYADAVQRLPEPAAAGGCVRVYDVEDAAGISHAAEGRQAVGECLLRLVRETGARRPWSDMLVLVSTNELAHDYAELLMEDGVPVITENSLLLAEHPLILQLVAFLRFLDRPEDDVALWTVLHGALLAGHSAFSLDSQALHDWRAAHARRQRPLWQAFREFRPDIWEHFLAPFLGRAGLMTPYDTLMEWCARLQAHERFPEAAVFLRCFMEVLACAEENGLASPAAFLHHWDQKGQEEKVPAPDNLDAVRVMTIHKSKGLQAPVVILPGTGMSLLVNRMLPVSVGGIRVVCRARAGMGEPYYREYVRQGVERLNQLYVAFTRACEELHIIRTPLASSARGSVTAGLDRLWELAGFAVPYAEGELPARTVAADAVSDAETCPPEGEPISPMADDISPTGPDDEERPWRPMQWLPALKIFRNPLGGAFRPQDRGEFLHHCLEHLAATAGDCAGSRAVAAWRRGRETFPRSVPEDDAFRQGILTALDWAAGQPLLMDWLGRGHAEQGLLVAGRDGLRAGRADLIVPGRRRHLVLEFKSGRPEAGHAAQLRGYLSCLPQDLPATGLLVYLDERCFRRVELTDATELLAELTQAFPCCHEV
ncbi:UvrD-helicase domain-containing protein [uncultured Desulfovibrio sp.]|uniref:UvrD-helicase domain-containing protein n=1 Tax=uncultured Desulfovibrio sp. TaxID=167968 RepID=UPI0026200EFC|nr:UvrD-helicase domain-containing protein [uncultured Desulfovibrio sp.]